MNSAPHCPECDKTIVASEIDLQNWIASCSGCGAEVAIRDLDYPDEDAEVIVGGIPKGVTLKPGFDNLEIHFSLFSLKKLLITLGITVFWNGIVSVFLSLAVAALCYQILGYVPDWIPVPGLEDGKPVMNDQVMGWGMTIFLCLFLTPFVTIGAYMLLQLLLRIGGWTKVVLDPRQCHIATGISFISLRRDFHPDDIKSINRVIHSQQSGNHQDNFRIEMTTSGKPIKFASLLSEEQQQWLLRLLKKALLKKDPVDFSQLYSELHR